jgi:SAM-dependent methyltransferase
LYDTLIELGCTGDSSILEVGCGSGEDAVHVKKASPHITGVDVCENALKKFRAPGFDGVMADTRALPFPMTASITSCARGCCTTWWDRQLDRVRKGICARDQAGGYVIALEPNVFNHSGLLMNIFNTIKPASPAWCRMRGLSHLLNSGMSSAGGLADARIVASSYVWNRYPWPSQSLSSSTTQTYGS